MRRRTFIAGLGSAAAWPLAARAQQAAMPVIGWLHVGSPATFEGQLPQFLQDLDALGHGVGRNVAIEFRWAENQFDRLPAMAAELVSQQVAVLSAIGLPAAIAAKAATARIPIVFTMGEDPVRVGLVTSLNRPGGNITGFTSFSNVMYGKKLQLLREIAPNAKTIAFLVNSSHPTAPSARAAVPETLLATADEVIQ